VGGTYPTFSIVVPTFRRPDALEETLAAILRLDYRTDRYQVIVVDDGADDETAGIVERFRGHGVELMLEAQSHRGAARARNQGARLAGGEMLLFCDDDMILERSHLQLHLSARERHGDAVVSGAWRFSPTVMETLRGSPFGRYRIYLEHGFREDGGGRPLDGDPGCLLMPLLGSGNLALSRDRFWEIGGFDEDFPVAGAEDQDFSIRARAAGARLLLDTNIHCLQNDNRLTLRDYCAREERSAETLPHLVRKYPSELGHVPYVTRNRPIQVGDSPRLVLKKVIKTVLAVPAVLESLHRLVGLVEAAHGPERLLRRLYRMLLGIHLFRGFRRSWRV
jgi:glycosyltransferase involved in cell wall biosynthesis